MNDPTGVLATRLEVLHTDVSEIKDALKTLSEAITKLALVEERQTQTALALERCFNAMHKLEGRVAALELAGVNNSRAVHWMDKAVIGVVVLAALFAAKKLGLA